MSKKSHTNVRKPTGDVKTNTRKVMHRQKQMDDAFYHEKYGATHKLMWILDEGGQLDKWIDVGTEPVERQSQNSRSFEGLSNRHGSKWVRVVGGTDQGGNTVYQYLLMIEHAIYDEVKIAPQKARQDEIRAALGLEGEEGVAPIEARKANKAGLETYAPYAADGTRGFNQIRSN